MRFLLLVAVSSARLAAYCPGDSFKISDLGECFLYSELAAKPGDAEKICQLYGGHLTAVHNAFENSIISSYALKALGSVQALIGLNRDNPDLKWAWQDESDADFFKWGPGQPSSGNCSALTVEGMTWRTIDCLIPLPFICRFAETPTTSPHTTTPDPDRVCLDGWKYFEFTNMCYYHGHEASFYDAEDYCQQHGGHLVSIHSDEENEFVKNLAFNDTCARNEQYWMMGDVILGGQLNVDTNTTDWWTDGSDTDYTAEICNLSWDGNGNNILLRAFPVDCFPCADGAWGTSPFESGSQAYPDFVCKARPISPDSPHKQASGRINN